MPDGGGKGHFATVAEMRVAVERHEVEITQLKLDVIDLTDMVAAGRRPKKRRKRRNVPPGR